MGHCTAIPTSQKAALHAQRCLYPPNPTKHLQNGSNRPITILFPPLLSPRSFPPVRHLDMPLLNHHAHSTRIRYEHWPEFESALFDWIQRVEEQVTISGDIIREKAKFFWQNLPIYQRKDMRSFSNGWLSIFLARWNVKSYIKHGEKGSVPEYSAQETVTIRRALSAYNLRDVFNCDKTFLFWEKISGRSLYTQSSWKKEKTRIPALFCSNADGSECLPIWFIGTAKKSSCLFRPVETSIQNLKLV